MQGFFIFAPATCLKNDYNSRCIKHHDKRKQNKLRANFYNLFLFFSLHKNV